MLRTGLAALAAIVLIFTPAPAQSSAAVDSRPTQPTVCAPCSVPVLESQPALAPLFANTMKTTWVFEGSPLTYSTQRLPDEPDWVWRFRHMDDVATFWWEVGEPDANTTVRTTYEVEYTLAAAITEVGSMTGTDILYAHYYDLSESMDKFPPDMPARTTPARLVAALAWAPGSRSILAA